VSRLQGGVNVIHRYPFKKDSLVVDVLGKPTDWREVVQNVGDGFETLAAHVFTLGEKGEKRVVCPVPVHKPNITSSKTLKVLTARPGQAALYRGSSADGALILKGEVYALASADCPTVSIHDPKATTTVVVHFSRQSGVVGDILQNALTHFRDVDPSCLLATISLGIDTEHFDHRWDHPDYGEGNEALTRDLIKRFGKRAVSHNWSHGGINLKFVAIAMLLQVGLKKHNIYVDAIDTYSDARFWSQRASDTRESTKFGDTGRNLVLVANLG
jgi:copper oxidase (laccase) domain-containing protein